MARDGAIVFLIDLINLVFTLLWLLVLAHVIVSWVLNPWHEVRRFIDSIVDPMLAPIRRVMPQTVGIDFSPLVLLILLNIVQRLVISLLIGLA